MPRETKAEKQARHDAAMAFHHQQMEEGYPNFLMEMLERACKVQFEMMVFNGKFVVSDRLGQYDDFEFTYKYDRYSRDTLSEMEYYVGMREEKEAKAQREYMARQAALAKLTKEERELLGL